MIEQKQTPLISIAAQALHLPVENGQPQAVLAAFLRLLLEEGLVEAVMVPQRLPDGVSVAPTLVHRSARLEQVDIFTPLLPVNSARVVSDLTMVATGEKRIAVVLRPCEIRALVELAKFRQANYDHLLVMAMDCMGTVEPNQYRTLASENGPINPNRASPDQLPLRVSCQICLYPAASLLPGTWDLSLSLIGVDPTQELIIDVGSELGKEVAEKLQLTATPQDRGEREQVIEELLRNKHAHREEVFAHIRGQIGHLSGLLSLLSRCIRCYNCSTVCPICYCKECILRTATFSRSLDEYLRWGQRKGGIRLPADTLLFHLTRLNHMVTSCVGCGMCESACPNDVPVGQIFQAIGEKVQALFNYVPGLNREEMPPVATFRENELNPI